MIILWFLRALPEFAPAGAATIGAARLLRESPSLFSDQMLVIGAFVLFLPFLLSCTDMWQRCAAISKHDDAKCWIAGSLKWGAVVFGILFLIPIIAGLTYRVIHPSPSPDAPYAAPLMAPLIETLAALPPLVQWLLLSMLLSCFLAAAVSTADTLLLAAVYALFYDVLGSTRKQPQVDFDDCSPLEHLRLIAKGRTFVLVLGLLSVGITVLGAIGVDFTSLLLALFASVIIFAPALVGAVLAPRTARYGAACAILSISLGLLGVCLPLTAPLWYEGVTLRECAGAAPVAGFALSVLGYVAVLPLALVRRSKATGP